jgi:putative peptide zinc metalloprotease protein
MTASPLLVGTLNVAEDRAVYLCELRNGRYVRLSQAAYDLVRSVEAGATFDEIAEVARRSRSDVAASDIEAAYRTITAKLAAVEQRSAPKRGGFWLTFTLLPSRLVARLARPLAHAYHPAWGAILLSVLAIAGSLAVTRGVLEGGVGPTGFGAGYLLFLASLVAHELGHAAACVRFGARPGAIGATMYLVYPALYSDVTSAWVLRRWQRVIVDLGGAYFQLIVGAGFLAGFLATGWPALRIAVLLTIAACAVSLNPVMKFDGYWVVSDALGVTNLGQVPLRLGAVLWARMRRRKAVALPWPWPIVVVLAIYSVVTTGFWLYFLHFLVTGLGALAITYPALVHAAWIPLVEARVAAQPLFALFNATFMLVFGGLILLRVLGGVLRLAASRVRRGQRGG